MFDEIDDGSFLLSAGFDDRQHGFHEAHMAYAMDDGPLGSGHELFSLMRDSDLSPDEYVDRFHHTGAERTRTTD